MSTLAESMARYDAFDRLCDEVREYIKLPNNFDTYGGKAPSPDVTAWASSLFLCLGCFEGMPVPKMHPISRGVFIYWDIGGARFYFEADEKSVLYDWAGVTHQGGEIKYDVNVATELVRRFMSENLPRAGGETTEEFAADFELHASHIRTIARQMLGRHIGERCPEFDADCIACRYWKALDQLTENPFIDGEQLSEANGKAVRAILERPA